MSLDTATINVICAVIGGVIGYFVFIANTKKDSKNEGTTAGTIASDLGYLKKGIEDISAKLEKQEERYIVLAERVTKVESSTKQAHKRIDTLECKSDNAQHN